MNKKSAPDTAKVPPMTREMVAQWEAELDDFVVDIQSRLEGVAESIAGTSQVSTETVPAQHDAIDVVDNEPKHALATHLAADPQSNPIERQPLRQAPVSPTPAAQVPAAQVTTPQVAVSQGQIPQSFRERAPHQPAPAASSISAEVAGVSMPQEQTPDESLRKETVQRQPAPPEPAREPPTPSVAANGVGSNIQQDETTDRLEAIKQKLAARLQGESS